MSILPGVVLLAARTSRARAYVEALVSAGLAPARLVVFGSHGEPTPPVLDGPHWPQRLRRPTLRRTVEDMAAEARWETSVLNAESVNDAEVLADLKLHAPELVIYAGRGGEIVRPELLHVAPFLHMHSGWLPRYRGSTTLYYSMLETGRCACSALLLDSTIDTGSVVARRHYPTPMGCDVDDLYDGAVRADLLLRVMRHYRRMGTLPVPRSQVGLGKTYYVIHPVLKHIARLGAERKSATWGNGE